MIWNKGWIIGVVFVAGGIIGWMIHNPDIPEPTIVTNTVTEYVTDTVEVEIPVPVYIEPSVPDTVEDTAGGLVRSTKTFELGNFDVKVNMLAECPVQLVDIEILNIKPMEIVYEKEYVTVTQIETIVVEPSWIEGRTAGIIIGSAATILVVFAAGSLAK